MCLDCVGGEQEFHLVQNDGHVDRVRSQLVHAEQEVDGCLKLPGQEQHLEVQERLLGRTEVGLTCRDKEKEINLESVFVCLFVCLYCIPG